MLQKNILISDLPSDVKKYIYTYLDRQSLSFFGMSSKSNLSEVLPILLRIQAELFSPSNIGLIAGIRGSSFCYIKNVYYACGNCEPRYGNKFADIQKGRNDLPGEILTLAAGLGHTLVHTTTGLYAFGENSCGQLGLGDKKGRRENFEKITNAPNNIAQISLGYLHTLILTKEGQLYGCGDNEFSQFALKDKQYSMLTHLEFPSNIRIVQVAAGKTHSLALTTEGKVYVCGHHERALDLGKNFTTGWVEIENIKGVVKKIYAGENHSVIWTTEGVFGSRCGFGNIFSKMILPPETKIKQIAVSGGRTLLLTENGMLYHYDSYNGGLATLFYQQLEGIQQVATGSKYTLALTTKGLYVCGENNLGQLGLGDHHKRENWVLVDSLQPRFNEIFAFNNLVNRLKQIVLVNKEELAKVDTKNLIIT